MQEERVRMTSATYLYNYLHIFIKYSYARKWLVYQFKENCWSHLYKKKKKSEKWIQWHILDDYVHNFIHGSDGGAL